MGSAAPTAAADGARNGGALTLRRSRTHPHKAGDRGLRTQRHSYPQRRAHCSKDLRVEPRSRPLFLPRRARYITQRFGPFHLGRKCACVCRSRLDSCGGYCNHPSAHTAVCVNDAGEPCGMEGRISFSFPKIFVGTLGTNRNAR